MQVNITFELDTARLPHCTDNHLAQLWHLAQANPAPFGDVQACRFTEEVRREIIRRFLVATPPELWHHQGRHMEHADHQTATSAPALAAQGGAV